MHSIRVFSFLIFLTTIALQMSPVTASCCPCSEASSTCNDGTRCTPYCGQGPCNMYGCRCHGGCRSHAQERSTQNINIIEDPTGSYFDAGDIDKDGKLSFDEWAAAPQNEGLSREFLAERWAKYDTAGVGYLTRTEVIHRLA